LTTKTDAQNPLFLTGPKRTRTPLEIRRDAAQATLEKFRDVPFEAGKTDCAQIVKFHLRQLGRPLKFGEPLNYKSMLQARALLKRLGFASVGDALGSKFPEIVPAMALVGDIIELAAEEDEKARALGGLVIYLGNNAVFGFHETLPGGTVMRIGEPGYQPPLRAWRVL